MELAQDEPLITLLLVLLKASLKRSLSQDALLLNIED